MKHKVTFVLTSCGRVDLLDPTLESFFKKNSYKLEDLFLVEDSVDFDVYDHIKRKWSKKFFTSCFNAYCIYFSDYGK